MVCKQIFLRKGQIKLKNFEEFSLDPTDVPGSKDTCERCPVFTPIVAIMNELPSHNQGTQKDSLESKVFAHNVKTRANAIDVDKRCEDRRHGCSTARQHLGCKVYMFGSIVPAAITAIEEG